MKDRTTGEEHHNINVWSVNTQQNPILAFDTAQRGVHALSHTILHYNTHGNLNNTTHHAIAAPKPTSETDTAHVMNHSGTNAHTSSTDICDVCTRAVRAASAGNFFVSFDVLMNGVSALVNTYVAQFAQLASSHTERQLD